MSFPFKYIVIRNSKITITNLEGESSDLYLKLVEAQEHFSEGTALTIKSTDIENAQKTKCRYINSNENTIYFFSTSNRHLESTSIFKTETDIFVSTLENMEKEIKRIEEKHNNSLRRLTHNITKYVALGLQQAELIFPQHEMGKRTWKAKNRYLTDVIERDHYQATKAILNLAKYSQGLKTEISIYNKLLASEPVLQFERHNIHRVIMNSLYFFFPEFTDKNIEVNVEGFNYDACFDYESISVTLYHLFENAAKYCAPDSRLDISAKEVDAKIIIDFKMLSLQILPGDKNEIFREGVRGQQAKTYDFSGNGVGLYVMNRLLALNKGKLSIDARDKLTGR